MIEGPVPLDQVARRYPVLRFFTYRHLPPHLWDTSRRLHDLAWEMAALLPYDPETSAGLRKLLEAKDCLVRAALNTGENDDE